MSDSFFVHSENRKAISTIYAAAVFSINVESSLGLGRTEKFLITVDKLSSRDLLQIRISDATDQTKMFISTIDTGLFERIKSEQSLNVSFDGFVEHFIKILDACKRGELHLTLNKDSGNDQTLKFYEKRSFRNLVHLWLPIEVPPVEFILHYINLAYTSVQHQYNMSYQQALKLEKEIECRDAQINELRTDLKSMASKLTDQENLVFTRNSENINRLQQEIKHISDAKEIEIRKLNHSIKTLQDTVDYLTKENFTSNEKLSKEVKKSETLRDEVRQLKTTTTAAREENEKFRQDLQLHQNQIRKSDHLMAEQRKQMVVLQDRIREHQKDRTELNAELEAEKQISRDKKKAFEVASRDINKANDIIMKQVRQIAELERKVQLDTEVGLQQERHAKELVTANAELKDRLNELNDEAKENKDVFGKIQELKDATENINKKYSRKIQELKNQLAHVNAETELNSTTSRYLQISNRNDQ